MANEETIIQLKGMGKEFKTANGPVVALNDINLDIYRGEILDYWPFRSRKEHTGKMYQYAGGSHIWTGAV